MKKIWLFIIVQSVFCNCFVQAQFIRAGYYTSNDHYFDVVPDSVLEALNVHLTPKPGETMLIDVDNDAVMDFKIYSHAGGGLGGGTGFCGITPLISNAEVVSRLDTSTGCCPQQYIVHVAKEMHYGDTVNDNCNFYALNYLWSNTYGASSAPVIYDWQNIGEHFIGFRIVYPTSKVYGWIRVEATGSPGYFCLTVKDFACNKRPDIGIKELNNEYNTKIYPNIFNEKLIVSTKYNEQAEIVIYNMTSGIILEKYFSKELIINTSCFSKGFYFYIVRGKSGLLDKGKIIKN